MESQFYQPENIYTGNYNNDYTKMKSPPPYPGSPQQNNLDYYDLDQPMETTVNDYFRETIQNEPEVTLSLFEVKNERPSSVVPRNRTGKITKTPKAAPAASRPGRKAKTPDEALNKVELERRNRRRARNREAAQRQRERRMEKVDGLENEVLNLKFENEKIEKENEEMKEQVKNLRFKLDLQLKSKPKEKPKSLPIQLNQFEPITPVCNIPDELFTPNGSFVLNTPKDGIVNFQFPETCSLLEEAQSSSTKLFSEIL